MNKGFRQQLPELAWLGIAVAFLAGQSVAQTDEELPTLKLDRIPAMPTFAGQTRAPQAATSDYSVETVVGGLSAPWALAFLPHGEILVTENTGTMRVIDGHRQLSDAVDGLPAMSHEGWAGLFDLTLDPDFEENELIYFSYVALSDDDEPKNISRVASARFERASLQLHDLNVIVDGFGGQELHFAPDGTLLVSGASDGRQEDAQNKSVTGGKLLRINSDGTTPADNPFATIAGARSELFTYGHRDISGIATRPDTNEVWITEHGPRGGDELNLIIAGANYGWKVISYGTKYNGDLIGNGSNSQDGMQQPRYFWRPSIAPSGLEFYSGDMFPEWQGSVFVTSLSGQHITRLAMNGKDVMSEERMLVDREQRLRELRVGPDGALYVLTNEKSATPKGTAELLRIAR